MGGGRRKDGGQPSAIPRRHKNKRTTTANALEDQLESELVDVEGGADPGKESVDGVQETEHNED